MRHSAFYVKRLLVGGVLGISSCYVDKSLALMLCHHILRIPSRFAVSLLLQRSVTGPIGLLWSPFAAVINLVKVFCPVHSVGAVRKWLGYVCRSSFVESLLIRLVRTASPFFSGLV